MFKCHICNSTRFQTQFVQEIFQGEGRFQWVENMSASVCSSCGEAVFSRETTERIRQMLHGEAAPVKSVAVDVFTYQPQAS